MSTNPLAQIVEDNEDKIYALFKLSSGRLNFEPKAGEKADFLEIKVLNEDAKLAGIVWFFGHRRAYIQDVRNLVDRKKKQQIIFVLVAGEGTTSAGKKELKSHSIEIVKNLDDVKVTGSKRKKKKKQPSVKVETISIEDDVSLTDSSPLVAHAKFILQKSEPEIIKAEKTSYGNYDAFDLKGYTSTNDLIAIARTIDINTIGVNHIRDFINSVDTGVDGVNISLISNDKFTPSANKEANQNLINLISLKHYNKLVSVTRDDALIDRLQWGVVDMMEHLGYKVIKRKDANFMRIETGSSNLGTYIYSENKEKENILALIPTEEVVRVASIREFKEQIDILGIENGWIIAVKRFTYTADREAKSAEIKILKKNHPVFNIFGHYLVPIHQLMTKVEIRDMLKKFHAELNQLPRIYVDDHGVVAINGKPGDVVRILRTEDSTAYRLVIPAPASATD